MSRRGLVDQSRQVSRLLLQGQWAEVRDLLLDLCVFVADECEKRDVRFTRNPWEQPPWRSWTIWLAAALRPGRVRARGRFTAR
jgi:hypothetical protein